MESGLNGKLHKFGAYTKALELFDLVVGDLEPLQGDYVMARLVSQQLGSADSIAANIEEGYGRGTKRDFAHFLTIARGSARETAGRYARLRHWLPDDVVAQRVALCSEIIAILNATIRKLRTQINEGA